eukprot:7633160-Pyramimonas_sp.AAC.1
MSPWQVGHFVKERRQLAMQRAQKVWWQCSTEVGTSVRPLHTAHVSSRSSISAAGALCSACRAAQKISNTLKRVNRFVLRI